MAGADESGEAVKAGMLRAGASRALALPSWLRWGAVPVVALAGAGTLASAPAAYHATAGPTTFSASDWPGLSLPALSGTSPTPPTTPAPPATGPTTTPTPPLACASTPGAAPPVAAPAVTSVTTPPSGLAHVAPARYVADGPAQAVLTGVSAGTGDPLGSTIGTLGSTIGGIEGAVGGIVSAAGGSTGSTGSLSAAGLPTGGLSSLLPLSSPSTTTTLPRVGSTNPGAGPAKPTTNDVTGPSTATPAAAGSSQVVALPSSSFGSSGDTGCELIGSGSVGNDAPAETQAQATAVQTALDQLGTPYVWGGESKSGFDCSGLVQFSYARAGIHLPRVAQDQYDAGPAVAPGSVVVPGDLVFFGNGPTDVHHVGMFVGDGLMVDAPFTGAVVRLDRIEGFAPLVGVTAPGGQQIA